jgi:uncharacterized SAM-binding protein YcdF (DUF218 family)
MTDSRKRFLAISAIAVLCMGGAVYAFSDPILYGLGAILVNGEKPQKADIVVVIGGDYKGNRITKGAELVREGYAPKVLASGSGGMYGMFESDLEIGYAVGRGYPRDSFISVQFPALSTVDEARIVIAKMRQLGVHKYLLVTSDYHTARAGRVFRRQGRDLEEHTIAAPDPAWNNGRWWTSREGRKLWLYETLKTMTDPLGF